MIKLNKKTIGFFVLSLLVHVTLFVALLVAYVPAHYRMPGKVKPGQTIIQVSSVSQQKIDQVIKARRERLRQIQLAKQRKLAAIRRAKQRRLAALRLARQKRLEAARRLAQKKRLAVKQQQLQQQLQQQALFSSEQQLLKKQQKLMLEAVHRKLQREKQQVKQAQQAINQGVVDQYKAQIKAAVSSAWHNPPVYNHKTSCVLHVRLAPGGVVLSVSVVRSSGNDAYDRSAKNAFYQASPLPVPSNPSLFRQLSEFTILMRPKDPATIQAQA